MSAELILTCPICAQPGFTIRGLRAHRCPGTNPPCAPCVGNPTGTQIKRPLTKAEWQTAINIARQIHSYRPS